MELFFFFGEGRSKTKASSLHNWNWIPKRVSFFQRAMKWNFQTCDSKTSQPKSEVTSGGNKHRPRRHSFWLSDTEIDMGAFLALQAKRVSWSTLVRRPQLNHVHTVNVNASDIFGLVLNFAGKSLKFIPVVKPQSFSGCRDQIQKLAARRLRLRDVVTIHNTVASSSRHLTVGRFWIFNFRGFLYKFVKCPAIPEFAA